MKSPRLLAALATVVAVAFGMPSYPAQAAVGPDNSWTQEFPATEQPQASPPDNCNPCTAWPKDSYHERWSYQGSDTTLHKAIQGAMEGWNGQQYHSPMFAESGNSPQLIFAEDHGEHGGNGNTNYCGITQLGVSSSVVTPIHIWFNRSFPWRYGYPNGYDPNACDITNAILHEVGHAYYEGHSATSSNADGVPDMMYWNGGGDDYIDSDAQGMLNTVYGPLQNSSSGQSGGSNCAPTDGPLQAACQVMGPGWIGGDPVAIIEYKLAQVGDTANHALYAVPDPSSLSLLPGGVCPTDWGVSYTLAVFEIWRAVC